MTRQFIFTIIFGIVALPCVLIFGNIGYVIFGLMAFMPFIQGKRKPDERELYLLYKTGNYTIVFLIWALVIIDQLSIWTTYGNFIKEHWLMLSMTAFCIISGTTGLVIFKSK